MILTRSSGLLTLSILLLAAMPAAGASAKSKAKRPTVKSVAPLTVTVGDQLTIKGKNFVLGKKRNTIFFKAAGQPAVSAKTVISTRKMIKVIIPKSVEKYMSVEGGRVQPTQFRLRILAKRFGKRYTSLGMSPTISPLPRIAPRPGSPGAAPPTGPAADCDGDLVVDTADSDDDNDLLSDVLEASLKLGRCDQDSDNDGVEDGYEYQSALDFNRTNSPLLPYPGKRPYPNPLDGTDAGSDYDGDGLYARQEHLMWRTFGPRSLVLNYSAGMKTSDAGPNTDDDRDVDADALGNWVEFNGPMVPKWWSAIFKDEKDYFFLSNPGLHPVYDATSAIVQDSDGDGLADGADDVDQDGWTNAQEVNRNPLRVQPFNPCLPDPWNSPTCSEHPPVKDDAYPPFDQDSVAPGLQVWPMPEPPPAP